MNFHSEQNIVKSNIRTKTIEDRRPQSTGGSDDNNRRLIMVQVTQTEEEIKIIIELNRLITRKPDIVLLPYYLKFNNPPIFFERHLTHEIDEMASFCRIFKTEARIVLIKKDRGIWPEPFQKLSKEELMQKRLEIADQIVERNKERDQQAQIRYEQKRRTEIEKEVRRESAMRERIKQFEENACREALAVGVVRKETHTKQKSDTRTTTGSAVSSAIVTSIGGGSGKVGSRVSTPAVRPTAVAALRTAGKINVCFSPNFTSQTPKRESQEGVPNPFFMQPKTPQESNEKVEMDLPE